jgi:hypothetical protein
MHRILAKAPSVRTPPYRRTSTTIRRGSANVTTL